MRNIFKDILKGKTVIVGIGNTMKGDDGFGPALTQKLDGIVKAVCIDSGTAPENYVGSIARENPNTILLADAVCMDLDPGEYRILKPEEILKSGFTTHDISPAMFIEYLKKRTKAKIYMLGAQPQNMSLGDEMSHSVKKALAEVHVLIKRACNE